MHASAVFFHHCLFHGAWGKFPGRYYAVAKFAARPKDAAQFKLYDDYYKIDAAGLAQRDCWRLRLLAARDAAMRQRFAEGPRL